MNDFESLNEINNEAAEARNAEIAEGRNAQIKFTPRSRSKPKPKLKAINESDGRGEQATQHLPGTILLLKHDEIPVLKYQIRTQYSDEYLERLGGSIVAVGRVEQTLKLRPLEPEDIPELKDPSLAKLGLVLVDGHHRLLSVSNLAKSLNPKERKLGEAPIECQIVDVAKAHHLSYQYRVNSGMGLSLLEKAAHVKSLLADGKNTQAYVAKLINENQPKVSFLSKISSYPNCIQNLMAERDRGGAEITDEQRIRITNELHEYQMSAAEGVCSAIHLNPKAYNRDDLLALQKYLPDLKRQEKESKSWLPELELMLALPRVNITKEILGQLDNLYRKSRNDLYPEIVATIRRDKEITAETISQIKEYEKTLTFKPKEAGRVDTPYADHKEPKSKLNIEKPLVAVIEIDGKERAWIDPLLIDEHEGFVFAYFGESKDPVRIDLGYQKIRLVGMKTIEALKNEESKSHKKAT